MNWFANLKTAYKLLMGFGFCLAFGLVVSVLAVKRMELMNDITQDIATNIVHGVGEIGEIDASIAEFRSKEFKRVASKTQTGIQAAEKGMDGVSVFL